MSKLDPAFPFTVAKKYIAGVPVENDVYTGLTRRQYYAAHAPEMPDWFGYKPHPHDPGERKRTSTAAL